MFLAGYDDGPYLMNIHMPYMQMYAAAVQMKTWIWRFVCTYMQVAFGVFFLFAWDFPSKAVYFDDKEFCDVCFHILLTSYPMQRI